MNETLKKPIIYSDIHGLSKKMEKQKKHVRELIAEAKSMSVSIHLKEMKRAV